MKSRYKLTSYYGICFVLSVWGLVGCKKLVETNAPVTSVNGANVYANDPTSSSVLTGIYTNMSKGGLYFTGNGSISMYLGLSSDEFSLFSGVSTSDAKYYYYTNSLFAQATSGAGSDYWAPLYQYIFICNAALEGLNNSKTLTPAVQQQLLGEANFMRAFFYFYLVNMFGDVPLVTNTNYKVNATSARTSKVEVYQQIISDLKSAQGLLTNDFVDASAITKTIERTRPNKWAATALLARTYLYIGDWANAIEQANLIINNTNLFNLTTLKDAFLKNSRESIWQLQPVSSQRNTEDAWVFIIPPTGPNASNYPVYLSPQLLKSFEPFDQRRVNWVDSVIVNSNTFYFPSKYKSAKLSAPLTEYLTVFRLAELYLIRAQAQAEQNNIGAAQSDLNVIRNRANLNSITVSDKTSLLAAILHERQIELFTEWGHRWLDLKRTNNIDAVMMIVSPQKNGSQWKSYQQFFPLPFADVTRDINLTQNPGF